MATDKYSAVWVSHSSISDFLKCPRSYYLKNVYKDPVTNHKIAVMSPALALGQAVHEVVESLSLLPTDARFRESLIAKYERAWQKISGERGGFTSAAQEQKFKDRGAAMIRRVMEHPGPVARRAVKIKMDLPHYWLSEDDGIILCGKIDWLEWLPERESVSIVDFKTGKIDEDTESLQLPIYHLLVANCQKWPVESAFYWYLERDDELSPCELPNLDTAQERVLEVAKQIKLARKLELFKCSKGGCFACRDYEAVLRGEAKQVGTDEMRRDIYIMPDQLQTEPESEIL